MVCTSGMNQKVPRMECQFGGGGQNSKNLLYIFSVSTIQRQNDFYTNFASFHIVLILPFYSFCSLF